MSLSIRWLVSRNGPPSKNKPLLSFLQTPIHILLGFDVCRQTDSFVCSTAAKWDTCGTEVLLCVWTCWEYWNLITLVLASKVVVKPREDLGLCLLSSQSRDVTQREASPLSPFLATEIWLKTTLEGRNRAKNIKTPNLFQRNWLCLKQRVKKLKPKGTLKDNGSDL